MLVSKCEIEMTHERKRKFRSIARNSENKVNESVPISFIIRQMKNNRENETVDFEGS